MASENKEIGDIVKKSKILLLDIEGTTTSISFVKDKLFPYAEENAAKFLDTQWENCDVKEAVTALRKLAAEDQENTVEGVVAIPGEDASKDEQIEGLVKSVKWLMSADRKVGALKQLQGLIWKQGYDNGDIKGHVFDDVSAALEAWRAAEGQKVYIYSSGSVQAQKLLFGQSVAGDLLKHIEGHFDTAVGAKQEADSYKTIVEKIGCKADEILFLTDIVKEAEAARAAGLQAALVSRAGNAPLPAAAAAAAAAAAFPVLHSLADLTVSNKRKPEPQDEVPAKILKTDDGVGVKTTTEVEPVVEVAAEKEEPEKMEVEEEVTKEAEEPSVKEPIAVEEVTKVEAEPVNNEKPTPPVIEEVVEEKEVKTDAKQTETKSPDVVPDDKQENKKTEAPVAEDSPAVVIEDVTEKPLPEVAEIIEDIVPVVEEPMADIEELQNVGDVLEKECDEILSKVQDVTNLDNIPVKPLLNTIAEETMETENTDTNDIVDRILDTEMDLEMKQCTDVDLNTVTEMSDEAETDGLQENGVKEASLTEVKDLPEQITAEIKEVTENNITENKIEDASPKESEPTVTKEQTEVAKKPETDSKELSAEVDSTETVNATVTNENNEPEKKIDKEALVKEEAKVIPEVVEITADKPDPTPETPAAEETAPVVEEVKAPEPEQEEKNIEKDVPEPQVNGKATNGDAEKVTQNGDVSKDDEINERLSVENGKVNGSNGNSMEATEQGQGDCKMEPEVIDIKVKTVTTDEPRTDPIEQPTEA